jgi:glycerol-3-phosphate acyltransferase PlsY
MIHYTLPLLAYCFGSISSAIIVCRIMGLPDPLKSGSNNPGATNVLRIGGKTAAIITLVGDVLKGLLPVLVASMLGSDPLVLSLVGLGAYLGHLFPLFFGFKGGKGVATAFGVFIGLSWQLAVALLVVWLISAAVFRYSSLAALIAAVAAPAIVLRLLPEWPYFCLAVAIAILLLWRHRENISRLRSGTESRIRLGK